MAGTCLWTRIAPPRFRARLLPLVAVAALLTAACGQASPTLTTPVEASASSSSGSTVSSSIESEPVLAPELQVVLFDGTAFDLAEHLSRDGRPVVLHLWSSSCPACLADMPSLDEAARRHPEVLFVGIAVGDDQAAAESAAAESAAAYGLGARPRRIRCGQLPRGQPAGHFPHRQRWHPSRRGLRRVGAGGHRRPGHPLPDGLTPAHALASPRRCSTRRSAARTSGS